MNSSIRLPLLFLMLILLIAIPVTVFTIRQQQDIRQQAAEDMRQPYIAVVSDFNRLPIIKEKLLPLDAVWKNQGMGVLYINVSDSASSPGRDAAEKLRNYLADQLNSYYIKYLFLIDVRFSTVGEHIVPSRLFTTSNQTKIWNDYYYSDLVGVFDTNQNNIYEIFNDYNSGDKSKRTIVGRILFESSNLSTQLEKYVASNILFRQSNKISKAIMIKHLDGTFRSSGSAKWPTGSENEEAQTLQQAFVSNDIQSKSYIGPASKEDLFSVINQESPDLLYFFGHGSINAQQIKSTDLVNDSDGVYIYDSELINAPNISKSLITFFQGCETGRMYFDLTNSTCNDPTLCSSSPSIAQSLVLNQNPTSKAAVASVASSITGTSYPSDFADYLFSSFWNESLAFAVNEVNWYTFAISGGYARMSLLYFGDPSLPFPKYMKADARNPEIFFNEIGNIYAAVDYETGVEKLEISVDNNPYSLVTGYPNDVQIMNGAYLYSDHTVKIKATDRANNQIEIQKNYPIPPPTIDQLSNGLKGEYFKTKLFIYPAFSRKDNNVDFQWSIGSPDPRIPSDLFSVRWNGYIVPPTSGTYTFYTNSDDGVRLSINNQLLIDKWGIQGATEWSGTINLTEDQLYPIELDYFEEQQGAMVQLLWSGPGISKQIIPNNVLYTSFTPLTIPTPSFAISRVDISPGSITNAQIGEEVHLSALAFDINGKDIGQGVSYQWGISSTNSIGTLNTTTGAITNFLAQRAGQGDIFVTATYNGQSVTKSIPVTVASSTSPTPNPALPGDATGDRVVNALDFNEVVANFNRTGSGMPADLIKDGVINSLDLNEVIINYGKTG